VQRSAKDIT